MAFQNNCTPQPIYGPYRQTLFLGLSVRDFTLSAGLNQQATNVTVNLVNDVCSGTRDYLDSDFIWQTGVSFSNGDPGYNSPTLGSPVIFKIAESYSGANDENPEDRTIVEAGFEFAGILQSFNTVSGPDGLDLVTVNLSSPNTILNGVQFIVDRLSDEIPDISGSLDIANDKLPNIFNVYGYLESLGGECLDYKDPFTGAGVGSPAGGFGNSQRTERGIPWVWTKKAIQVLTGGKYTSQDKKFALEPGTIRYPSGVGTYGSIKSSHYILDISELPGERDPNVDNAYGPIQDDNEFNGLDNLQYKIVGPVISASDIISTVAEDAGYDYYIELLPTFDTSFDNGPIVNVIKVKAIPRNNYTDAQTLSGIQTFIDNSTGVLNHSIGTEFVNENTNAVLIGGLRQDMFQLFPTGDENATQGAYGKVQPFFGYQPRGVGQTPFVSGQFVKEPITVWWGQDPPTYGPTVPEAAKAEATGQAYLHQWFFDLDYDKLPLNFNYNAIPSYYRGDPESLLCAALGDWESFIRWFFRYGAGPVDDNCEPRVGFEHRSTKLWYLVNSVVEQQQIKSNGFFDPLKLPLVDGISLPSPQDEYRLEYSNARGIKDKGLGILDRQSMLYQDLKTIYEYLNDIAEKYYGKSFAVEIPYVCRSVDTDTQQVIYSDLPSTDGGWADECIPLPSDAAPPDNPGDNPNSDPSNGPENANSGCAAGTFRNIMGLDHRNETDIFTDDQGKLPVILKYNPLIGYGPYHDEYQKYLDSGIAEGKDYDTLVQGKGAPNFIRNTHIGFNDEFYTQGGGGFDSVGLITDPWKPIYAKAEIDPEWLLINKPIYNTGESGIAPKRYEYASGYNEDANLSLGLTFNALVTLSDRLLLAPSVRKNDKQGPDLPVYVSDAPYFGRDEVAGGRFLGNNWRLATFHNKNTIKGGCSFSGEFDNFDPNSPAPDEKDELSSGNNTIKHIEDSHLKIYGNFPFALPCNALIPVKSNTRTYGPWSKFSNKTTTVDPTGEFDESIQITDIILGKTFTAQEDGLVPWEYGATEYLNQSAEAKLNQIVMPQQQIERGSITVAGYPAIQLGYNVNQKQNHLDNDDKGEYRRLDFGSYNSPNGPQYFGYLNTDLLTTGTAQVTNITVNVNPGGITTQYQLNSFTNLFGRFDKGNAEKIKSDGLEKYSRERSIRANKREGQNNALIARNNSENNKYSFKPGNSFADRSPATLLVGKYSDKNTYPSGYTKSADNTIMDLPDVNNVARKEVATHSNTDVKFFGKVYDNSSMMSMDGFFRPVQTRNSADAGFGAGIPIENDAPDISYESTIYRSGPYSKQVKQSESPPGPLNQYTGLIINTDYLDFLANPGSDLANRGQAGITTSGFVPIGSGHDIEIVARSSLDNISTNNNMKLGVLAKDNDITYSEDYRYLAHRGPLVLHGWGYDVYGKPVPNANETGVFSGIPGQSGLPVNEWVSGSPFSGLHRKDYNLLSDKFHPGFLNQPETWPVGPVDLRWDRKRSVWTVPNNFRLYVANLQDPLSGLGNSVTAAVYNADDVYDESGSRPLDWEIEVTMPLPDVAIDAEPILVYYSHESGQWWPISYCCSSEGGGGGGTPPGGGDDNPCDECTGNCYWQWDGTKWNKRGSDNCDPTHDCFCQPPNYDGIPGVPSDLLINTNCSQADCFGGGGGVQDLSGGSSDPIVYAASESNSVTAAKVYGSVLVDMPYNQSFTYGSGINPKYTSYTGLLVDITGTGHSSALITDCIGTGNDTECFNRDVFNSGGFETFCVANVDNSYALPVGTKISVQFDAGLQCYRIISYTLPNNGCQEVTASTGLYYYSKVMADASAGQVILDLPLSTATGIAGSEFYIKKIDATANNVIISGTESDLIDGQSTYTITNQYEAAKVVNCGSGTWYVL